MSEPRRFECTGCGDCCRVHGYVYFKDHEARAAAALLGMTADEFHERFLDDISDGHAIVIPPKAACPFLLDDACTIQPVKPMQCRTYPFWPELVGSDLAWRAEAARCEGIGRGRIYTEEEIHRVVTGEATTGDPQ